MTKDDELRHHHSNTRKPMLSQLNRRLGLWITGVSWIAAVGTGFLLLTDYAVRPGARAMTPTFWPRATTIPRKANLPTLVMFAHPHCPCTSASIEELTRIMNNCSEAVSTYVLFFKPETFSPNWEQTRNWHSAAAIPGAHVRCDQDGIEAKRFGVMTSGHVLLYDAHGDLLFSGGITAARGHQGDNLGVQSVIDLLKGRKAKRVQTPTFGCPLFMAPASSQ